MTINFYAGMVPTADDFQALSGFYVTQGTAQSSTSSTTLGDSALIVPVNGLAELSLFARYTTGSPGGGIRWAWRSTGTVSMLARNVMSPAQSGITVISSNQAFTGMRWRQIATPTEVHTIANYSGSTTQMFSEQCIVDGVGELVLQFAQETSHATATTLHPNSYAIITALRS